MVTIDRLAHAYFFAKNYIIGKGFGNEIDWQQENSYDKITEQKFLNEISWVILASGMNDKVVRKVFPLIKKIMFDFNSSELIYKNRRQCLNKSLKIFNHKGKISAIIFVAEYVKKQTFEVVNYRIMKGGIDFIKTFPYMGNATSFHLAKNIGLDYSKPDRHLVRISSSLGFNNPNELCYEISNRIQEKISLIDLVLWRYATLDKNYLKKLNWYMSH